MKGLITIMPGTDLTDPVDTDWASTEVSKQKTDKEH
jgi:hypothetical protein